MRLKADERAEIARIALKASREPIGYLYVFGSYATGHAVRSSDLDLMVRGDTKVSATNLMSIEQGLEDSNLAYTVDIVDYYSLDIDVRDAMLTDAEVIYRRP